MTSTALLTANTKHVITLVFGYLFAFEFARLTLSPLLGKSFGILYLWVLVFWLLILLKFRWQSDLLLSSKSFEGLKLSVKPLHLLAQVDVVVLKGNTCYSNSAMGLNLIWAAVHDLKISCP